MNYFAMIWLTPQERKHSFMPSYIDLHSHSTVSDGTLAPAQLVAHAAALGVRVLALTDHDDMSGLAEAQEAAQQHGLALVNGVEVSATWNGATVHVVGLKVNPGYAPLVEGLASIRQGRYRRAESIAAGLEQAGIPGGLEGARRYAGRDIISRTHFARFLVERGYVKDIATVFKKYLTRGKPGYVEHRWASLEEAVGWVTGSGGVAVLAHPGRYGLGRVNLLRLLTEFRELGGCAIEVISGSHAPWQHRQFAQFAQQFGLLASVGSDYHGPGHNTIEMGRLPELHSGCVPVWQEWEEAVKLH